MRFLTRLWSSIQESRVTASLPGLIHADLPLVMRALRDLARPDIEKIRIDSQEAVQQVAEFAKKMIPDTTYNIELYSAERPIFDLYGIEDEIQKALARKVELKSGGHLVIDQTEAMTTIDVNTGGFVGHRDLEETTFKTNLEAAQAICRQLRLRNLGGIIIIDFIDMLDAEHRRQVLRTLDKCLARDHAKSCITEVSALGLVEMTRKRTRESLEHILCEPCPCCDGRGSLKTAESTCYEIFREILRDARQFDVKSLLVLASPEVIEMLLDEESTNLADLESLVGKAIKLQVEALYTQENYDIVLL
jgi:ribonuclease G